MSLSATWMDEILCSKSDEWIDGYVFAKDCSVPLYFGRGGWDKVYDYDNGWVYVCGADMN